jgi:hypothetical protein
MAHRNGTTGKLVYNVGERCANCGSRLQWCDTDDDFCASCQHSAIAHLDPDLVQVVPVGDHLGFLVYNGRFAGCLTIDRNSNKRRGRGAVLSLSCWIVARALRQGRVLQGSST